MSRVHCFMRAYVHMCVQVQIHMCICLWGPEDKNLKCHLQEGYTAPFKTRSLTEIWSLIN